MTNSRLIEKLEHWQHCLLDLSKRNKMINYNQPRHSALSIVTPYYNDLYTRLVENEEKLIFKMPYTSDIRVFSLLTLLEQLSAPLEVSVGDIKTNCSFEEAAKTLKNLRAKSKSSLEEKGSHILYLSFGFLEWYNTDRDWVKSPLIIVPVSLTLESLNAPFELKKYDDEILINPTLNYYFKTKFGVELPEFSENQDTLDGYFRKIEELADLRGWKISTEVNLGLLSFQKISMYNDLINNQDRIKQHPIIRAMAEGIDEREEVFQIPENILNCQLDELDVQDSYQVLSADSSQQDAILYSKNNVSFVMQGPPGTGKSQTIANIIAEALANDKKILFVAEKATALQVVLQRLSDVNLSDFCLSLHSSDAKKRSILEELEANLQLNSPKVKDIALNQLEQLSSLKDELNSYVRELHQSISPLKISCYEASGNLTELLPYPQVSFPINSIEQVTQAQLYTYTKVLQDYNHSLDNLQGTMKDNPWKGLSARVAGYEFSETMKRTLGVMNQCLDSAILSLSEIYEIPSIQEVFTCENRENFAAFTSKMCDLPSVPNTWHKAENHDFSIYISLVEGTSKDYEALLNIKNTLLCVYQKEIFNFPVFSWKTDLLVLEKKFASALSIDNFAQGEIIEKIIPLQDFFSLLNEIQNELTALFADIENVLGISFVPSQESLSTLNSLVQILTKNPHLSSMFFLGNPEFLERKIEEGIENTKQLLKIKEDILLNFEETILDLEVSTLTERFKVTYSPLFLETATKFSVDYKQLRNSFIGKDSDFSDGIISDALNTIAEWKKVSHELEQDKCLYENSLTTVELYNKKREEVFLLKKEILEEWEDIVFTKQAKPLLERYTTEYDSFAKVINRNYYVDKKEIQGFYKYRDKITPILVKQILEQLKNYEKKNKVFLELESSYQQSCVATKNYNELQNREMSLMSNLSQNWDYQNLVANCEGYSNRFNTLYNNEFKGHYREYLDDLKKLKTHHRDFHVELTYEMAATIIKQISSYNGILKWFQENDTHMKELFRTEYQLHYTQWDVLSNNLADVVQIKELLHFSIPQTFLNKIDTDYKGTIYEVSVLIEKAINLVNKYENLLNSQIVLLNKKIDIDFNDFDFSEIALNMCKEILNKFEELQNFYLDPSITLTDNVASFGKLSDYEEITEKLRTQEGLLLSVLGDLYDHDSTAWPSILELLNFYKEVRKSDIFESLRPIFQCTKQRKMEISYIFDQIDKNFRAISADESWLFSNFVYFFNPKEICLPELLAKFHNCLENMSLLLPWIDYEEAKAQCLALNLNEFLSALEDVGVVKDIDKVFLREFYKKWIDYYGNKLDAVRKFRRNSHDSMIEEFLDLDRLQLTIAQSRIREKLIARLPLEHQKITKANDELSILRRELDKKRKLLPLRELFRSIPNLLLRLKPCLLMSPLSVATLLQAEIYEFDLLIFDEASQIFPEDAIGSLLRAKQVIVTGDSKQLPPSNFFSSAGSTQNKGDFDSDDEYEELIADSILEESVKILHNRTLQWHYRSKYENLISFSNQEIYRNKLITFPSKLVMDTDVGLEFVYVEDGYYESGKTKSYNTKEAEKCAMLVHRHISTQPNRTLGIIAFSQKQQAEIENQIQRLREKYPQFEYFFDESKHEPFFVKNLENVQGDERDTILFSIGYAKEKDKEKMAMRFGPLGQVGGERRLNVAITRAKYNIKLVSSILPSDIDLTRTNSEGVRMLRSYIEFAQSQSNVENVLSPEKTIVTDNKEDFVTAISTFLENNGYIIKQYVGTSEYKVDIAVENPKIKGEFFVAIECDGECYKKARTARDRDHLRGTMLTAMGWKKYRVWSTEWIRNTDKEKKSLLEFIEKSYSETDIPQNQNPSEKLLSKFDTYTMDDYLEVVEEISESSTNPFGFLYYEPFKDFDFNDYTSLHDHKKICENLLKILSVESPVAKETLMKKVLPSLGLEKLTASVKRILNDLIDRALNEEIAIDEENFVWILPKTDVEVKIPLTATPERNIDQISTQEVAKALYTLADFLYGPTIADLISELGRIYGFSRSSKKIKEKADKAFRILLNENKIKIIDGKVIVEKISN